MNNPVDREVQEVFKLLVKVKEGEDIDHKQIEKVLGYGPPPSQDTRYYNVISDARLLASQNLNIEFVSIRGYGYKRITHPERIGEAAKRRRCALNNLYKCKDLSQRTDETKLNKKMKKQRIANISYCDECFVLFNKPKFKSSF